MKITAMAFFLGLISLLSYSRTNAQDRKRTKPEFKKYDEDKDHRLDSTEFANMNADYFPEEEKESDADIQLQVNEFQDTSFGRMDRNGDGNINPEEWQFAQDSIFTDCLREVRFDDYDANTDQVLSSAEFRMALSESTCYEKHGSPPGEKGKMVSPGPQTFRSLDENNDGFIQPSEFKKYTPLKYLK